MEERARRERLRDLAVFERLDGNPGKTSSSLAVKKVIFTIKITRIDYRHVIISFMLNTLKEATKKS